LKIYTYYKYVPDLGDAPKNLLDFWISDWSLLGWEPIVLGEEEARQHPFYKEFCSLVSRVPTTNPRVYEEACFVRHLAMCVAGGGLMVDTDVFNLSLSPNDLPDTQGPLILDHGRVPCAVLASSSGYDFLTKAMAAYGSTCSSDMHAVQTLGVPYIDICREFPDYTGKLIHFPTCKLGGNKLDRIRQELKEKRK
jgi:hypothetical protein